MKHAPIPEENHEETPDLNLNLNLTNNNTMSFDREYGEDDKYYSPTRFNKWRNNRSVIKRSSPMQVYTCNVIMDLSFSISKFHKMFLILFLTMHCFSCWMMNLDA